MCGRFTQKTAPADLAAVFDLAEEPVNLGQRFNIAPSQPVLVIPNAPGPRRAVAMRWGLVPHWARDPAIGNQLANGRSETAATKPSFRQALRQRRGLLLMDGFFEWRTEGRQKFPVWFSRADGAPFAVAALWEQWQPPPTNDQATTPWVTTCLLTTTPNPAVAAIHDRMPVIVDRAHWQRWLEPGPVDPQAVADLLAPWPGELMAREVSRRVNDARVDGPECIEPEAERRPVQLRLIDPTNC